MGILIFKKILIIILIFTLLSLTSCYIPIKTDYMKNYNKFLSYSLGDYKVVDKKVSKWKEQLFPLYHSSIKWTLEYYDYNNTKMEFKVSNRSNNGIVLKPDDANFGFAVFITARNICENELMQNLCSKYFDIEKDVDTKVSIVPEIIKPNIKTPPNYQPDFDEDFYISCINYKSGIILKNITAKKLFKEWNIKSMPSIETKIKDEVKLTEMINKTKLLMLDFIEYLDMDYIESEIKSLDPEHSYKLLYNKKDNFFNVITAQQEMDASSSS